MHQHTAGFFRGVTTVHTVVGVQGNALPRCIMHALGDREHIVLVHPKSDFKRQPCTVVPAQGQRVFAIKQRAGGFPQCVGVRQGDRYIGRCRAPAEIHIISPLGIHGAENAYVRAVGLYGFAVLLEHQIIQPGTTQVDAPLNGRGINGNAGIRPIGHIRDRRSSSLCSGCLTRASNCCRGWSGLAGYSLSYLRSRLMCRSLGKEVIKPDKNQS